MSQLQKALAICSGHWGVLIGTALLAAGNFALIAIIPSVLK